MNSEADKYSVALMITTLNASDANDPLDEETLLNMASIRYPFLFAYITVFLLCVVGMFIVHQLCIINQEVGKLFNHSKFHANASLLYAVVCKQRGKIFWEGYLRI